MMEMLPLGPPVVGSALAYLHAGLGPSGNTRVAIIKKKISLQFTHFNTVLHV